MNSTTPINQLLANLGYRPADLINISVKRRNGGLLPCPVLVRDVATAVVAEGADCWFDSAPRRADLPAGKRGGEADTVAIRTLTVDLDDAKLAPVAQRQLIARLTDELGASPAVVATGHGRHAHWAVAHTSWAHWAGPTDPAFTRVRLLYRRWSAYTAQCAQDLGGAVDDLKDMARMWRVPGTQNVKGSRTRPVKLVSLGSSAVRLMDLRTLLDARGVAAEHVGEYNRWPATTAECGAYFADNTTCRAHDRHWFLTGLRNQWPRLYEQTNSCHQSMVSLYAEAVRQVRARYCDAATADRFLYELFCAALDDAGRMTPQREAGLSDEWAGIRSWAISNGSAANPATTYREIQQRRRNYRKQVAR